jgi:hypothetical protein
VNGMTSGRGPVRPGGITAPPRLVIDRPRDGWILGLASTGIKALAGLAAVAVALAVLGVVTVVLWWAGVVSIPLVVLAYLLIVLPACGFAVGRASLVFLPQVLPRGPERFTWQPGSGRIGAGLVWEQDDTTAGAPGATSQSWEFPGGDEP